MFWGLKLEKGNNYSRVVDNSFHISNATLTSPGSGTEFASSLVAVHAVVNKENYVLCYLGKVLDSGNTTLQQSLNLDFSEGELITLYIDHISGSNCTVDLTGYFTTLCDEDSDEDITSELLDSDIEGEGEDANGHSLTALVEELPDEVSDDDSVTKKRKRSQSPIEAEGNGLDSPVAKKKRLKKKRKKENTPKSEGEKEKASKSEGDSGKIKQSNKQKKRNSYKTNGGTEVEDLEEGSGKIAKPGKKVFVKYTGRLAHNNRIFDSNIDGQKAFLFRLGQGEVVKGWDEGVQGMKIGGKRRLLIPPGQGYGSKGAPPKIPPNSRLSFDIELINVK